MGNSLRCCLACVLPCGALDLIRIVHLNGYVEEITGPITAGQVLEANPNHVLSKPCAQGVVRRILILSPESELKRGSIYFLIPASSVPADKTRSAHNNHKSRLSSSKTHRHQRSLCTVSDNDDNDNDDSHYHHQLPHRAVSTKRRSSRRDRRMGRSIDISWRPHLESISEDL